MDNIRLITILPTQGAQGVTQPTGTQGITTQGAGILVNLPPGSILSGYIVNRDASGNPVLRTDRGDVTFASNLFLKIGSEVVIRVENLAGTIRAHILSVNGQPPEIAAAQSAFADEPEVIVGREPPAARPPAAQAPATTIATSPTATANTAITGTVLPSPPGQPPPALPVGTQIVVKLVSIASPVPPPGTAAATPAANAPASYTAYTRAAASPAIPTAPPQTVTTAATATIPAAAPGVPASPSAPITVTQETSAPPPLTTLAAAVTTPPASPGQPSAAPPQIPTIPPAAPTPIQPGQPLQATVIGNEPSGAVVVQTQAGLVRLPPGIQLPPHSQVTFEVTQVTPGTAQTLQTAGAAPPAPVTELARGWDSLQQVVTLLAQGASQPGMPPPPGALPLLLQPDPQEGGVTPRHLSTGLLLFIVALKGGDFRNWLGRDNARWLEDRGHGMLLKAAEGDFLGIARRFADAPPQHWQPLFFPVAAPGGEIQQARLFAKRDRKKDGGAGKPGKDGDTRFILEVDLTQLGGMQMDGFVRRRERDVEFDLVIRSLVPLTAEMQSNILDIYNKTGEMTGYRGQVSFQAVREFPIHPMEELIAEHISSVIA